MQSVLLCTALGACSDPRADQATHARLDRVRNQLDQFREREEEGPRRLADAMKEIRAEGRWHDGHLRRDLARVQAWAESDVKRWKERQPEYRQEISDQLDGDLKAADDTIPLLFY